MSKEAMKLALEALQKIYIAPEHEEYIRVWWPACEEAITALQKALANEALDKKAENARELGLDYEPAQRTWVGLVWGELPEDGHNHDFLRGAVWAEAKLKEKNT